MATAPPAPPKGSPPKLPPKSKGAAPVATSNKQFSVSSGITRAAHKVTIYGPGGVGKTSLAALLESVLDAPPVFIDLDEGSQDLEVRRVEGVTNWDDLKAALLNEAIWKNCGAVVIDSMTKAEELAVAWTLANVPHEKGHNVTSIEGYGFGKGYTLVFETFLQLFGLLDTHARQGRHVICICHECTANVPNPSGDDWIRYEPRLQSPASGKSSIRHRLKEWSDHLLYVGFDVHVTKDGKGQGAGTRMIYPTELPTHWAKSRKLREEIEYPEGSAELWVSLLKGGNNAR